MHKPHRVSRNALRMIGARDGCWAGAEMDSLSVAAREIAAAVDSGIMPPEDEAEYWLGFWHGRAALRAGRSQAEAIEAEVVQS